MAVNTRNSIVTNGLVFYVDAANPQSHTSGSSVWNNISGIGNNGTLTRNNNFSPIPFLDVSTKSMVFTGSIFATASIQSNQTGSVCIVNPYSSVNISGSNPLSVSVLFMFRDYPAVVSRSVGGWDTSNGTALLMKNGYSPSYGIDITYDIASTPPSGSWTRAKILAGVRGPSTPTTSSTINSNINLTPYQWYQATFTSVWNGSFQDSKLYVNGVLDNTNTSTTRFMEFWNTGNITLGGTSLVQGNGLYSNINIATGMIYNRVLSQSEITQNYNALKARYNLL